MLDSYGYPIRRLEGPSRIYNSGMAQTSIGPILASRRWNQKKGHCDIVFRTADTGKIIKEFELATRYDLEDARLFVHKGELWMAFTEGRYYKSPWLSVQRLAKLSPKLETERVVDIHYAGNFTRSEKNWQFFSHDGHIHFVYSVSPHIVVKIDDNGQVLKEWVTKPKVFWPHGTLSGGTPPVRVGGYVSFAHSYVPMKERNRLYSFAAYEFEAQPPFEITRITEPLMWGDPDELTLPNPSVEWWLPVVVFPVGALKTAQGWKLSCGVNDSFDAIIDIPDPLPFNAIGDYSNPRVSFFCTDNASLPIKVGGEYLEWKLARQAKGGLRWGVMAISDAAAVVALRSKPGVKQITEEEYARW
jgi:hypothetical protein